MDLQQILPQIKIQKSQILLLQIVKFNARVIEEKNKNLITIHINSFHGLSITGKPIKIDDHNNCVFINDSGSIGFYELPETFNLEVINPEPIWDILTDGMYFDLSSSDIPTTLQVKKNWADVQSELKNAYGFDLDKEILNDSELTDVLKYQIQKFGIILQEVFASIAIDQDGTDALKSLRKVGIRQADKSLQVKIVDTKELLIYLDLNKKLDQDIVPRLQNEIESKF